MLLETATALLPFLFYLAFRDPSLVLAGVLLLGLGRLVPLFVREFSYRTRVYGVCMGVAAFPAVGLFLWSRDAGLAVAFFAFASHVLFLIFRRRPPLRGCLVDTSALVDGRILALLEAGIISGPFLVPSPVIEELQLLSDSRGPEKRRLGRTGFRVLERLPDKHTVKVKKEKGGYTDFVLLRLAKDLGVKILTADYNLVQACRQRGVSVVDLTGLNNLSSPLVIGERIKVKLVREGQKNGQAVGFLGDGSMVVVEEGKAYIGKEVDVVVTNIVRGEAGRIVFGSIIDSERKLC